MSGEDENYKDGVRSLAQFKNSSDPRFISEALSSLTISSNKGNPRAMLLLGGIYRNGCGVPIDYKRANLYFAESAKQGDADAIFNLCWAHLRGNGFEQNYEKALSYGLDAAKLGHSEAQLVLGLMFRRGHGCEKNYPEAIKWIELSSQQENGNAKAQLKDLLDSVEYKNYLKIQEISNELVTMHWCASYLSDEKEGKKRKNNVLTNQCNLIAELPILCLQMLLDELKTESLK